MVISHASFDSVRSVRIVRILICVIGQFSPSLLPRQVAWQKVKVILRLSQLLRPELACLLYEKFIPMRVVIWESVVQMKVIWFLSVVMMLSVAMIMLCPTGISQEKTYN